MKLAWILLACIRIRPVSGLVAADYFAAGYFVWAVLIVKLARIGYEEKNMYMAAYDWRLSFQNSEISCGWILQLDREGSIFYSTAPKWISCQSNINGSLVPGKVL